MADAMRDTEFLLRLYILDYGLAADELSGALGVVPTYTHTKGAPVLSGGVFKRNIWCKQAKSSGSLRMDHHISRFLDALTPLPERITKMAGHRVVDLTCHINDYGKGYVIYCDAALAKRLAEMNASLEVVVYDGVNDPQSQNKEALDLGFLPEDD